MKAYYAFKDVAGNLVRPAVGEKFEVVRADLVGISELHVVLKRVIPRESNCVGQPSMFGEDFDSAPGARCKSWSR